MEVLVNPTQVQMMGESGPPGSSNAGSPTQGKGMETPTQGKAKGDEDNDVDPYRTRTVDWLRLAVGASKFDPRCLDAMEKFWANAVENNGGFRRQKNSKICCGDSSCCGEKESDAFAANAVILAANLHADLLYAPAPPEAATTAIRKTIWPELTRFNHSCAPNMAIRNGEIAYALRDISPGEELCWNYTGGPEIFYRDYKSRQILLKKAGMPSPCRCAVCNVSEKKRAVVDAVRGNLGQRFREFMSVTAPQIDFARKSLSPENWRPKNWQEGDPQPGPTIEHRLNPGKLASTTAIQLHQTAEELIVDLKRAKVMDFQSYGVLYYVKFCLLRSLVCECPKMTGEAMDAVEEAIRYSRRLWGGSDFRVVESEVGRLWGYVNAYHEFLAVIVGAGASAAGAPPTEKEGKGAVNQEEGKQAMKEK